MGRFKHEITYNGHKHKLAIVGKDKYRCTVKGCTRWYAQVNWMLRIMNRSPKEYFLRPDRDKGELFMVTLVSRKEGKSWLKGLMFD